LVLKRLRDLGDRESQNILELEADKFRAALQELYDEVFFRKSTGLSPDESFDLGPFLAQGSLDLLDKTSQPIIGNF
jgi:hypothetical protein